MADNQPTGASWRRIPPLPWVLAGAVAVLALLWAASVIGEALADLDFEGLNHPYLVLFGFVTADAIIPIFPSESLLNTASTLAAQTDSNIEIWRLVVAGALGATVGDSILYWTSRTVLRGFMTDRVAQAEENEKLAQSLALLRGNAPQLIVMGRFVPGLRFVVGATMGLTKHPYKNFLLWDAIGGTIWAAFTCVSSYLVASALNDQPILSMVVSMVLTTVLLTMFYRSFKQSWDAPMEPSPESVGPTD